MYCGPGASGRSQSAQARANDLVYLSMGSTAAPAKANSSRNTSPPLRPGARLVASPRGIRRNATPTQQAVQLGQSVQRNAGVSDSVLEAAWAELREHVAESRPNRDTRERTEDECHPDPDRLRRTCQVLVRVVNQIKEPKLRRVMAVLCEEVFGACFRDYSWSYDPRQVSAGQQGCQMASSLPVLSEEQLVNVVPYFAVVRSLRETAKDAIVRRLELEAKVTQSPGGSELKGRRAIEEVRLQEELRHSRLLADTYQSRTLELEKTRIELEDQVRGLRSDRDKDDLTKQKLSNEVKRLRADADAVKAAKASWEAGKAASKALAQGSSSSLGRRGLTSNSSATSSSKGTRPGSAQSQRPAATTLQNSSTFGRAGRGLDSRRTPQAGLLSPSATEPSPRRNGTGLASMDSPRDIDSCRGTAGEGARTETIRIPEEEALTVEGEHNRIAGEAMAEQTLPCSADMLSSNVETTRPAMASRSRQPAATSTAAAADAAAGAFHGRVARKSLGSSPCASSIASPTPGGHKPLGKGPR